MKSINWNSATGRHAGERRSESRAHDGGLGDGRVDDTPGAESVDETVGDFKSAAVNADVFAKAEDSWVAVHFFPDSLADGFEISKLHRVSAADFFFSLRCGVLATVIRIRRAFGTGFTELPGWNSHPFEKKCETLFAQRAGRFFPQRRERGNYGMRIHSLDISIVCSD